MIFPPCYAFTFYKPHAEYVSKIYFGIFQDLILSIAPISEICTAVVVVDIVGTN
jgi:hypothetical protein